MAEEKELRRDRIKKFSFWRRHIESCEMSTLPASRYCRINGLSISNFRYWKRQVETIYPRRKEVEPSSLFVEVETKAYVTYEVGEPKRIIRIETPGGFIVGIETTCISSDLASILKMMRIASCS